jgi:hypothetical protein
LSYEIPDSQGVAGLIAAVIHSAWKDLRWGSEEDMRSAQRFFFGEDSHLVWMIAAIPELDIEEVRDRARERNSLPRRKSRVA